MSKLTAFTDASYNNQHKVGVIGILVRGQEPFVEIVHGGKGIAYLEKLALTKCAEDAKENIVIYTDHQGSHLLSFPNNNSGSARLVEVKFIKGHKKKAEKTSLDIEFSVIDRLVRKTLRGYIKAKLKI